MLNVTVRVPVIMCRLKGAGYGVQVTIAETRALRGSEHCASCVPRDHCDNYNRANSAQPKERQ